MSYFLVTAKCGHVGKNFYYKGNFYIEAENGRIAAQIVRDAPRVKHGHKDAILSVRKIEYQEFLIGKQKESQKPYYTCFSKQDQNKYWDEIKKDVYKDSHQEERYSKNKKIHSLINEYNDDPLYYQFRKGKIVNL